MRPQVTTAVFRFGPFELNAAQQELRRRGIRLRLPASRFRLLHLFVSRPGDLVRREEIAATLWRDSQTVDTMSGINTAVNQLREQLGDDISAPTYIETIVGVGYRFIATVVEDYPPAAALQGGRPDRPSETNGISKTELISITDPESAPDSSGHLAVRDNPATALQAGSYTGRKRGHGKNSIGLIVTFTAAALAVAGLSLYQFGRLGGTPKSELQFLRVTETGDVRFASISPDGKYVALVREKDDHQSVWLKQLRSGQMLQLVLLGTDFCPGLDFSPDGAYVYFVRKERMRPDGELWRVPILGGNSTPILAGVSGAPAISPDGKSVAFVRSTLATHGEDSIVVAGLAGESERVLASFNPPGIHFNRVTWTADGSNLIFPLSSHLFSISVSGGSAQPLPGPNWVTITDLWRLPSTSDLVVVGSRLGDASSRVFQVSLSTGRMKAITDDLSAFATVRAPREDDALLAVQDLTLSSIQVLKPGQDVTPRVISEGTLNRDGTDGLAWTPHDEIVYTSEPGHRAELIEIDRDGANPRRVALTDAQVFSDPVIAPREDFIAFTRWFANDGANIWRMNLDGTGQKQLTDGRQDFSPSISPDGKWVVYASVQGDSSVLMKVPTDSGPAVQLTSYSADNPAISPDGKWIACTILSNPAERPKLAIVPAQGGPAANTFPLPPAGVSPPLVWTPDSRSVTFINNVDGVGNIWRQSLAGGPATPITHFASGRISNFRWSHDGWLAIARGTESADAVEIRNY